MAKTEKTIRSIGVVLCQIFALYTIAMLLVTQQYSRLPLAFVTVVLVLLPAAVEKLLRCHMHPALYIFGLLYAIGPMLGQCHNFYYTISWWDKLLHICGGILFSIMGLYLCKALNHGHSPRLLCAVFALCLSIAVSAVWEFVEFGSDCLLHSDMQDDSVITSIYSYLLGDSLGSAGSIEHIDTVLVNGTPLPVTGYIDIGLLDTMADMLLESLGAVITCGLYLLDKDKHPLIRSRNTPQERETP